MGRLLIRPPTSSEHCVQFLDCVLDDFGSTQSQSPQAEDESTRSDKASKTAQPADFIRFPRNAANHFDCFGLRRRDEGRHGRGGSIDHGAAGQRGCYDG